MVKHHRKHTRKTRKTHKRRGSRQRGGAFDIEPEVASWKAANLSLPQGVQFAGMHVGQHGGAAPVGYTGVLPTDMLASARTDATMAQYGQIAGMKDADQMGGRRRRRGSRKARKSRKTSRKARKASRKSRKARRQRGGALAPAPINWVEAVSVPSGVNPQFKSWDASA